ncbi:hypothetical protein STRDD13_00330 [Streptococcus sp. DD13]|nr:hypothetical protein STRDD13_00330 [Streptococcus sp. DD13]
MTVFLFIGSRIYESFSFGETSLFMHYLFLVPLIGGLIFSIIQLLIPNLSRITFNLWNSGLATLTVGMLYRGIVNLSGRYTTLDLPYYYVGAIFLILSLISLFFIRSVWTKSNNS